MTRSGCLKSSIAAPSRKNSGLDTTANRLRGIADLCERVDADVLDVSRGIGLDSRIGPKFLNPGPALAARAFRRTRWR
jgi:UDPglucose 6-dehydrogenase